jgi:DNA-binding GntR family transcriptional regulator
LRRDQVYGELRRKLMAGEFALRERLVEERLATRLGVSRTPVREALVRLLADGLVTRHDGGYYVTLPDIARFITADRIERTISQHLEIVEAALAGQLAGAIRALRRHVGESMEVVEHRAARAVTQMVLGRARSG